MDSALNKMFGREFIVGFFLPAILFIIPASYLLSQFGFPTPWMDINWKELAHARDEDPLKKAALLGLMAWVFAVFLQALNREIFRFAEGYWPRRIWELCGCSQQQQFSTLKEKLKALREERKRCTTAGLGFEQESALMDLQRKLAVRFPSEADLILPTSFGNVMRAAEDYSRVVYGFESINGWARLEALMSKDFRQVIHSDRARVDLWLNLWLLGIVLCIGSVLHVAVHEKSLLQWLIPAGALMIVAIAYRRARSSAEQYGEQVKAAFDMYLPELANKLGFKLSWDTEKNRAFWISFSQMMVYPSKKSLQRMIDVGLKRAEAGDKRARVSTGPMESDDD